MSLHGADAASVASASRGGVGSTPSGWVLAGATALVAALFAAALGMYLAQEPPPVGIVAVASIGLLAVLALAVSRLWTAVVLGIALLAIVRVEPAPSDAVFAVVLMVALVTGQVRLNRVPGSVLLLASGYLLLNVVSATAAVDTGRALLFFGITLYLIVFAVWLAGALATERQAKAVMLAYLGAAVASAAAGALAMNVGFPGSEILIDKGGTRARALFEDANVYSPFLVPAALFVLHEIIRPAMLRARTSTKLVLFAILCLGILFSYSRASWANLLLGIAVMTFVLALRGGYGGRLLKLVLVLGLAGAVVAAVVISTGNADFVGERTGLQSYDQERFRAQREGIALGERMPLGIGPGQYETVVQYAAHSTYVRAFAEHGLIGLAMLVGLLLTTFILGVRNAFSGRDTLGIPAAALLGAWCGLLLSSFVVDTLHWRHLWFVAALIWAGAMQPAVRQRLRGRGGGRGDLVESTDALLREATIVRRELRGVAQRLRDDAPPAR